MKSLLRPYIATIDRRLAQCRLYSEALYGGAIPDEGVGRGVQYRMCIVKDRAYFYVYNVLACRDLGVPYETLDLLADDWAERIGAIGCSAFLVWPTFFLSGLRSATEDRISLLTQITGKPSVPAAHEIWLQYSKRRTHDWLDAKCVPHAPTHVFFDRAAALRFCASSSYPLICKTDSGAASSGVFVLRNKRAARRVVHRAFGRGLGLRTTRTPEKQQGYVIFQTYISHSCEWRVVRVGDDYLCRRKRKVGEFASGSGEIEYAVPPSRLLDFVEEVTDIGGFRCMAVDVFEDSIGISEKGYLVNELQCLVGAKILPPNDAMGRWSREGKGWRFEKGDFYRNACANLRLAWLLARLRGTEPNPSEELQR